MSAKMSAARRQAFFDALGVTGNQTLAAEAAKVSRSWVTLHRSQDPAFRRRMDEAIAEARSRLSEHPERRPPSGWGFLDGEELVVKGTGGTRSARAGPGRRVQIARARLSQWTPRIEDRFLAVLAATGNAEAAYTAVGMSKGSAYEHRGRWPAFAARWDEAVARASLNLEFALIRHRGNPFSSEEPPVPADDLPPPSPQAALHQLHMTKHRLHGVGRKPGGWRRPDVEKVRAKVVRIADTIRRARALGEEDVARTDREIAARRRRRGDQPCGGR